MKCDELKAFNSSRIYWAVEQVERVAGDIDTLHLDDSQFYLKSEADKVIAELKADYKEACGRLQNANLIKDEQLAAARHNKYKRCLAMAGWCEATALWCYQAANTLPTGFHATLFGKPVMIETDRLYNRFELLTKWSNRWMKLAKQFKEAK